MAKFDFNRSLYARLFDKAEGIKLMKKIINTDGLLYTNYGWYKTQGSIAALPCPTDDEGVAAFRVTNRSIEAAPMMDLRAPLGEPLQMDEKGGSQYLATIPDFITRARAEKAMERDYRIKQFEATGDGDPLLAYWVGIVQQLKDSAEGTLTNLTARLMTENVVDYRGYGKGIQASLHEAPYIAENHVKAGKKVWSDPDCDILAQMAEIEDTFRTKWAYGGPMIWQVTRDTFYKVILKNKEVRALVKSFRWHNDEPWADTMPITEDMFRAAIGAYDGLSPIEIVTEKERNDANDQDVMVHGWKQNIAVLRPAGDAVSFEWTKPIDQYMYETYGNGDVTKNFQSMLGGLFTLVNETAKDGQYNKWATYGFMSSTPALVDWLHLVRVDISVAD